MARKIKLFHALYLTALCTTSASSAWGVEIDFISFKADTYINKNLAKSALSSVESGKKPFSSVAGKIKPKIVRSKHAFGKETLPAPVRLDLYLHAAPLKRVESERLPMELVLDMSQKIFPQNGTRVKLNVKYNDEKETRGILLLQLPLN